MLRKVATITFVIVFTLGLVLGAARKSQAQDQTVMNLSGTWELVEDNGSKKSSGDPRFPKLTLVIRHDGGELTITFRRIRISRLKNVNGTEDLRVLTYHTDGRGETNTGRVDTWFRLPESPSVTRLIESKVLIEFRYGTAVGTRKAASNNSYSTTDSRAQIKQEWSLNKAGNTLLLNTRTLNMNSPLITSAAGGDVRTASYAEWDRNKFVFRKVS